jgi:hypothetical protein
MLDRSTAQPMIFANLSRRPRLSQRALLLLAICSALVWTLASCRDVGADSGYCLACGGSESSLGAAMTATAGDGSGGHAQSAADSGHGGADTGSSSNVVASGSSSSGGAGATSANMTTQPVAAVGGSASRAGAGGSSTIAGVAGMSMSQAGGRGGASMTAAGHGAEPPMPEPCGGCPTDAPVCIVAANRCVECTIDDKHVCQGDKRACDVTSNTCAACTAIDETSCPSDRRVCNLDDFTCVECSPGRQGACGGDKSVCDANQCVECTADQPGSCGARVCEPVKKACVECLTSEHCGSVEKARCDSNNNCTQCTGDNDCAHLTATPVCDAASKRCVECSDGRGCGAGRVCDQTMKCMQDGMHELALCSACSNDGMCPVGDACVPYNGANGRPAASVCLAPKPMNTECDTRTFTRQISVTLANGTRGEYCAPPASCGTVSAFGQPCMQGSNGCGDNMLHDGTCTLANTCSYRCTREEDCPSGTPCSAGICQLPM